ncbi:MAG: hypothetical protein KatS3mg095_0150 [Candidatus Parcubacteria bacterium]|nr:MAG: hypothetical protein KatS3mg095_0150 [Candidatus Parcubacteria bacterium]
MVIKKANFIPVIIGIVFSSLVTSVLFFIYIQNTYKNKNGYNKNYSNVKSEDYFKTEKIINKENNIEEIQDNVIYEELRFNNFKIDTSSINIPNKNKSKNSNSNKTNNKSNNNSQDQQLLANLLFLFSNFRKQNSYSNEQNTYLNTTSSNNLNNNLENNFNNSTNNNSNNTSNNNTINNNSNTNNSNNNSNNNSDNSNEDVNLNNRNNNLNMTILISEILIDGGNSNDEYVELYNPNDFEVNLSGWKLIKINKNGNQQTLIGLRTRETFENRIIRPYSYLLIANIDGAYASIADIKYVGSYNLAKDNSIVLVNNNNEVVDLVGWGESRYYENNPFNPNPPQGKTLTRKAGYDSNFESMTNLETNFGNSFDSNNNSFDFILSNSEPQNSQNNPEIPPHNIHLTNFEDDDNSIIFDIISPYKRLNNAYYVLLEVNSTLIDEDQDFNNYIRNNWQSLVINNINLPQVEFYGKKQRIEINFNNDEKIYLLGLVENNQIINYVPDLND